MYEVKFTDNALDGVNKLMKSEPAAYKKLLKLSQELEEHPTTGTGKPEVLTPSERNPTFPHVKFI